MFYTVRASLARSFITKLVNMIFQKRMNPCRCRLAQAVTARGHKRSIMSLERIKGQGHRRAEVRCGGLQGRGIIQSGVGFRSSVGACAT